MLYAKYVVKQKSHFIQDVDQSIINHRKFMKHLIKN